MLQTGDIIRIREYIEIPVEHNLWDDRTYKFYRSYERDLEEGLFPGLYQVVTSVYTRHPTATVGDLIVLRSARIMPETNIVLPVGDDRFLVRGEKAIDTLERSAMTGKKEWRPEMGASNPPADLGPGMGIMIWGTVYNVVPVNYTNVRTRHGTRYAEDEGSSLRAGQYIVLDYDHKNSVLTLGLATWLHGEPVRQIYLNEEFVIRGRMEIKRFLEDPRVVLYGRVAGKKKWRPNDVKESLVDLKKPEITKAAAAALKRAGEDPGTFLARHGSGDWGVATEERVKSNEYVINHGGEGYIVSLFTLSTGESIIVSSHPALGTTVLAIEGEYTPPLAEIPGLGMGISLPDRQRLFEPGVVQGTPKAIEAMRSAGQDPAELLERHLSGDWGDAHHDDVRENMVALKTRDRVIGVYTLSTGKTVVIITDEGHEMTTVMTPDEF